MSTLTIPQLGFARSNPATRNTSGPLRFRAANRSARIAQPKSTIDERDQRGFVHGPRSTMGLRGPPWSNPRGWRRTFDM